MVRGIFLGLIFFFSTGLIILATTGISYEIDLLSLIFGLVIAGLTGFIWMMLGGWWMSATRPFRPMTITHQTRETPFQLGCAAVIAFLQTFALVIAVVVGVIWIIASLLNQ